MPLPRGTVRAIHFTLRAQWLPPDVQTQLPCSLLVALVAFVLGYIPAALGLPPVVGIGLGVAAMIAVLLVLRLDPRRDRLDARPPPPAP